MDRGTAGDILDNIKLLKEYHRGERLMFRNAYEPDDEHAEYNPLLVDIFNPAFDWKIEPAEVKIYITRFGNKVGAAFDTYAEAKRSLETNSGCDEIIEHAITPTRGN